MELLNNFLFFFHHFFLLNLAAPSLNHGCVESRIKSTLFIVVRLDGVDTTLDGSVVDLGGFVRSVLVFSCESWHISSLVVW